MSNFIRSVFLTNDDDDELQITFGTQSLQRVRQYTYDETQTRAIIDNLRSKPNQKTDFLVNFGAGLEVPDFHPFSFRPIVTVVHNSSSQGLVKSIDEGEAELTYYDTSRPCPPFCPSIPTSE